MTSPTPVRFPSEIDHAISELARRAGLSKSAVVVQGMDEWLRMQAHPRITFVRTNTGERRAALLAGPQVWTLAESWRQHPADERTSATIADSVGLPVVDVEAALDYWAEHREEIDLLLEQHEADQDAALAAWERRQALLAV